MMRRTHHTLLFAAMLVLLLVVFALYLQPDFLRAVADQVWACF
jgi:hypothetical protein